MQYYCYEFLRDEYGQASLIGFSSYGGVKLARNLLTNYIVAIKTIINRNAKEYIEVHYKLHHRNIIRLLNYYYDTQNNTTYMVLEYASNGTLHSKIKESFGQLSKHLIRGYFYDVCSAVKYLHENHIMHRDIKPENILITKDNRAKLCDFGLAAIIQNRVTVCGTFEYMAPEMILKLPYDNRIDIWALGILLYELIQGYAPFRGDTGEKVYQEMKKTLKLPKFSARFGNLEIDLLTKILRVNAHNRLTIEEILAHPFFDEENGRELLEMKYSKDCFKDSLTQEKKGRRQSVDWLKKETVPKWIGIIGKIKPQKFETNHLIKLKDRNTRQTQLPQRENSFSKMQNSPTGFIGSKSRSLSRSKQNLYGFGIYSKTNKSRYQITPISYYFLTPVAKNECKYFFVEESSTISQNLENNVKYCVEEFWSGKDVNPIKQLPYGGVTSPSKKKENGRVGFENGSSAGNSALNSTKISSMGIVEKGFRAMEGCRTMEQGYRSVYQSHRTVYQQSNRTVEQQSNRVLYQQSNRILEQQNSRPVYQNNKILEQQSHRTVYQNHKTIEQNNKTVLQNNNNSQLAFGRRQMNLFLQPSPNSNPNFPTQHSPTPQSPQLKSAKIELHSNQSAQPSHHQQLHLQLQQPTQMIPLPKIPILKVPLSSYPKYVLAAKQTCEYQRIQQGKCNWFNDPALPHNGNYLVNNFCETSHKYFTSYVSEISNPNGNVEQVLQAQHYRKFT